MKQQIDVYVKLTFECDAEFSTTAIHEAFSTKVIGGCQVFADELTAPVEIVDIQEEREIYHPTLSKLDRQLKIRLSNPMRESLINVLNYLADEELNYQNCSEKEQENHISPDVQHLWLLLE